jgi:hypothetical protein
MQVIITNKDGSFDITQMVPSVKWSGDFQQAARSLDFSVLASPTDKTVPVVDCSLGNIVQMSENGEILFEGVVVSRTKNTEASEISLSCYDRGFYLKRNKGLYKFSGATPESAVSRIAGEYDIKLGEITVTGVSLNRNFLTGKESLYDIISTMYTLASQSTGKKYNIGFRGDKLYVTVKEPDGRTLIIKGKSNLISAITTESIENLVNEVQIYDENGNYTRSIEDNERINLYGRLRETVRQAKGDDKAAEAQKLLDDGDVDQRITVNNLGNIANISGGTVVVQEPYTGIYGLFYIDNDLHEWKRGQYYNKLVINFKNLMDEKEAGSLPNADGGSTGGSVGSNPVKLQRTFKYTMHPEWRKEKEQ